MIHAGLGASAPMNEPAVKIAMPISIIFLRPNRSASTPLGTSVAALTMVNRLLIHESWAADAPGNALRISGKATDMIDRPIPVSTAVLMTIASTSHAWRAAAPDGFWTEVSIDGHHTCP